MSVLSDVIAERIVLSGVCKGGFDTYIDISDIINSHCFTLDSNQITYLCIEKLLEKDNNHQIDIPSILLEAKTLGFNDFFLKKAEREHLNALFTFPANPQNTIKYAKKLRKLEITRRLKTTLDSVISNIDCVSGDETLDEILGLAEGPILDFSNDLLTAGLSQPKNIASDIDEYIEFLKENQSDQIGISSGYHFYDKAIGGGLRRGTVNLVGARMKGAKSQLAMNVAKYVSTASDFPVLYLDTEMISTDQLNRLLANISQVEVNDIETGRFTKSEKSLEKVSKAAASLKRHKLCHINIAGRSFDEIISIARRWIIRDVGRDENGRFNDALIIYDYIKLMDDKGLQNLQEYQLLGLQMTNLHNFSVRYDVPVLAFIQLNRDGITKESTDTASGSDRLLWLCSNFSIFKDKSDEEKAKDGIENGNKKLVPLLARHGEGLRFGEYINFQFDGKIASIRELGTNLTINKNREFETSVEFDEMPFDDPR